jgi:hypothetical protein
MSLAEGRRELANLADVGQLRVEPGSPEEIESLLSSGSERLADARRESLALFSRFDPACNAAHALSLSALRWDGYQSENRYLVFQVLPHTLGLPATVWRVLAKARQVGKVSVRAAGRLLPRPFCATVSAVSARAAEV